MFNNPMYNNFYPYQNIKNPIKNFRLFNKPINWSNLLNNTQKTLNVINQAIPVYYQIKPIYNNAKTMFKMVNILKQDNNNQSETSSVKEKNTDSQGPVFFI